MCSATARSRACAAPDPPCRLAEARRGSPSWFGIFGVNRPPPRSRPAAAGRAGAAGRPVRDGFVSGSGRSDVRNRRPPWSRWGARRAPAAREAKRRHHSAAGHLERCRKVRSRGWGRKYKEACASLSEQARALNCSRPSVSGAQRHLKASDVAMVAHPTEQFWDNWRCDDLTMLRGLLIAAGVRVAWPWGVI